MFKNVVYSQERKTIDVFATGIGIDRDRALKNALLNSVNQSLGTLVDSESLVKNESIVKDQILTYSDGYVEKSYIIKESKRQDGLFEVKIKASVKKNKIIEKLNQEKITIMKIDGNSIFGEAFTKQENSKSAEELFKKAFDGIPVSLFDVELLDTKPSKTFLNKENNTVEAVWKIKVAYNKEKYYKNFVPTIERILEEMAIKKSKQSLITQLELYKKPFKILNEDHYLIEWRKGFNWRGLDHNIEKIFNSSNQIMLFLNISGNKAGDNLSWKYYLLDKSLYYNFLFGVGQRNPRLFISFLDSENNVIRQNDFYISEGSSTQEFIGESNDTFHFSFPRLISNAQKKAYDESFSYGCCYISPLIYFLSEHSGDWLTDAFTIELKCTFHIDEVKDITQIKVWLE